jgi:hypothetical protein
LLVIGRRMPAARCGVDAGFALIPIPTAIS